MNVQETTYWFRCRNENYFIVVVVGFVSGAQDVRIVRHAGVGGSRGLIYRFVSDLKDEHVISNKVKSI